MTFRNNVALTDEQVCQKIQSDDSSDILFLLLDLLESVTESVDLDDLLAKVGKASRMLMRVEASSLMLLDNSGKSLTLVNTTGPVKDNLYGKKIPSDYGYAGWVIEKKEPVIAHDVQNGDVFEGEISEDFTTRNLICVPLFNDDREIIGVLEAINRSGEDQFTQADIPLFQALANHTARTLERIHAKREIEKLKEEHQVLFSELHHRVKNDFAMISGIIQMESLDVTDNHTRTVLHDVKARIHAMASVYDLLAKREKGASADLKAYLEELVTRIAQNVSGAQQEVNVKTDIDSISVDSHAALSCGLILNELIVNSFKHAFVKNGEGEIVISAKKHGDNVELLYSDNGEGLSENYISKEADSLGFEIIHSLAKQIGATVEVKSDAGAQFKFYFQP